MEMQPKKTHDEQVIEILEENRRLVEQNNALLRRMNRIQRVALWFKIGTFLLFIGAPFIVYYWVLEPYFTNLGSSFSTFQTGLQEIPGWKQFYEAVGGDTSGE